MSESAQLLATIKRLLKFQGRTYKDVATALKLSEPSVKRLFASKRITIERLSQLCAFIGFTLAELALEAETSAPQISTLSVEQETQLVADPKLLLIAVCALNHWSMADITSVYQFTEVACLKHLLKLDRLRLIQLLPGNRIRLAVSRDFDWVPDGPIQQYFTAQCQNDFLKSNFQGTLESRAFLNGMFSNEALAELQREWVRLRKKFSQLHKESAALPIQQRSGIGMFFAMRSWEPPVFTQQRRRNSE